MGQNYEKLKNLLMDLFQLNQPDLDFGIYRIMHARGTEVTQFLEKDLLPQVKASFALYQPADKAALEKELTKLISGIEAAGMNPEDSPKVKELRARIATDAVDLDALESEVYDHLYSFFRRYYSEGDFLSKRVYKPGVYAIPYEGEEVKLHWANVDQYYIKTSEYLRDYAFRLHPGNEKNPMRVHFHLVDATEGEHGNAKEAQGKERRFKLAPAPFTAVEDGELVIRFTYEPNPTKQKDLNTEAEAAILGLQDSKFTDWLRPLGTRHVRTDGTVSDSTRLRVHLDRYTARNTFDYFIHKDLGGFLRRELDFYIKNEVMHLDDIESETAPRVDQYLSKIKVIRKIAGKIIEFLAQIENFQKKLWLKNKFVVETSYCIRLGVIPEDFYPEIAANNDQREEWVRLCAIDKIEGNLVTPGYSAPLMVDFLKAHPTLIVDTRHFPADFTAHLLDAIGDLDEMTDGMLVHSENFQALSLIQARFREQVKCVYIDPPYNAKSSEILYKNTYKHSSWLSLMADRTLAVMPLFTKPFVFITAIDEVENFRLGLIYESLFLNCEDSVIAIEHNPTGQQGSNFSFTHEYSHFVYPRGAKCIGFENRNDNKRKSKPDVRPLRNVSSGKDHLRTSAANCFYPIYVRNGKIIGFGDVCRDDFHPKGINQIRDDGVIEIYPIDPKGIESKWVFARHTVESILNELAPIYDSQKRIWDIIRTKSNFRYKSLWHDERYSANSWGSVVLNSILPGNPFTYPKSIYTVRDCIDVGFNNSMEGTVLDFFAGSGTTGHAIINLNREDGGQRKFILVEMADYFDTVLLPRLKKVTYTPVWKNGMPKRMATDEETERSPRIMKVIRLESYEDTLNNLELLRTKEQQRLLDLTEAQGPDRLKEQYILRYMLDVETRGSQSLLNITAFMDPTTYRLKVKRPGSDESHEVNVDLLETFNWLIGMTVQHIATPQTFTAEFERNSEGQLRLKGRLRQESSGRWWFRSVTGTTPDGRKTLVIWRNRPGGETAEGIEQDSLVLDEWFTKQGYSSKDSEFDIIYLNGDNNLENLKAPDDTWKVRLIEEDFFRLMFETEGA